MRSRATRAHAPYLHNHQHRHLFAQLVQRAIPTPKQRTFDTHATLHNLTPKQVYDVVSDVTSYQTFLPYVTDSTITERINHNQFNADLALGFKGIAAAYTSRVTLEPPHSVLAEALDSSVFHKLRTRWSFAPVGDDAKAGCIIRVNIEMQLKSHAHDQVLRRVMDSVAAQQVAAFKERCIAKYSRGGGGGSGGGVSSGTPPPLRRAAAVATASASRPTASASHPTASASRPSAVQVDPSWRHAAEQVFEAHASGDVLGLPRFVEACRALVAAGLQEPRLFPSTAAAPCATLDAALAAACFVELDADGSGAIDRSEWVTGLWMLTRASDDQKMHFAFAKLDLNRSGRIERDDVRAFMEHQLGLARAIAPAVVRQQLGGAADPHALAHLDADSAAAAACDAHSAASATLDALHAQIRAAIDELFEGAPLDRDGALTLDGWRQVWCRRATPLNPEPASLGEGLHQNFDH